MGDNNIETKVIRIGLLGDSKVGKSAICRAFTGLEFISEGVTTIGSDKFEKKIILNGGKEIKLILWDTAGQERFRSAAFKTIKSVHGIALVFDVSNKETFNNISLWLDDIKDNFDDPCLILFGNKTDKPKEEWQITQDEINTYIKEKNLTYYETSAKLNKGIDEGLAHIANDAFEQVEKTKKKPDDGKKNININNPTGTKKKKSC